MTEAITGIARWLLVVLGLVLLLVLSGSACADADAGQPQWQWSISTQFASKTIGDPVVKGITYDKWQGHVFFCTGKPTQPMAWGVAHRTLPCGSVVEVCKGKLCVMAPVITTGPFFAVPTTCNKWSQSCWELGKPIVRRTLRGSRYEHSWRFASDLDLLPRVAFAIRLGGKAVVKWRVVWRARKPN